MAAPVIEELRPLAHAVFLKRAQTVLIGETGHAVHSMVVNRIMTVVILKADRLFRVQRTAAGAAPDGERLVLKHPHIGAHGLYLSGVVKITRVRAKITGLEIGHSVAPVASRMRGPRSSDRRYQRADPPGTYRSRIGNSP